MTARRRAFRARCEETLRVPLLLVDLPRHPSGENRGPYDGCALESGASMPNRLGQRITASTTIHR